MTKPLDEFFKNFLDSEPLFKNKKALQSNYTPKDVPYRDQQIQALASILAPSLRMEKPSNLFVYGKTGTGKTLSIKHVANQILKVSKEQNISLDIVYINCKLKRVADTEYRIMAEISRAFGEDVPATGLPTDEIYKVFIRNIDKEKKLIILILDEIDQLINKIGDEILYNLTRLNSELKNSEISIIGISNSLVFTDHLDPRVKSSLSEEELVFPPYDAMQLQQILKQRADVAFKESSLDEGVIEKCAAYAAREHGDARRALELLRVAGELAERGGNKQVMVNHIDEAEEKIERDRVLDVVSTQPKQHQLTLFSIINICQNNKKAIFTGDIYDFYMNSCKKIGLNPLTQRRVSDIIGELDMLGMINVKVISKGRYGRTREIGLMIPDEILPKIQKILEDSLGL